MMMEPVTLAPVGATALIPVSQPAICRAGSVSQETFDNKALPGSMEASSAASLQAATADATTFRLDESGKCCNDQGSAMTPQGNTRLRTPGQKPDLTCNPELTRIGGDLRDAIPDPEAMAGSLTRLMAAVAPDDFAGLRQALDILFTLIRWSRFRAEALHVDKQLRDMTHLLKARSGAHFRTVAIPRETGPIPHETLRRWRSLYGVDPDVLEAWLITRRTPVSEEQVRNWLLRERIRKVVPR